MIPWSPPKMFVSIVGHAIFHTAARNGPSTMERSYRPAAATGAVGGMGGAESEMPSAGVETSVNGLGGVQGGASGETYVGQRCSETLGASPPHFIPARPPRYYL